MVSFLATFFVRPLTMIAIAGLTTLALVVPAQAGVIWEVAQVGNDVVATASGSFILRQPSSTQVIAVDRYVSKDFALASFTDDPSQTLPFVTNSNPQGVATQVPFLLDADTGTGQFGHVGAKVYLDSDYWYGSEPLHASLTWYGKTVDQVLGVGVALPGHPFDVWNEDSFLGDQTIAVVRAGVVPEPTAVAVWSFLGMLVFGSGASRRRRKQLSCTVSRGR